MCVECHSPRDDRGRLAESEPFHGAPVPVEAHFPGMDWAFRAPDIAGLTGFTDEQEIALLTTGRARPAARRRARPCPAFA